MKASYIIAFVLALAAVGFMVLRDLSTRSLSREIPSLYVAFITAIATGVFAGAVALLRDWRPIELPQIGLLLSSDVSP